MRISTVGRKVGSGQVRWGGWLSQTRPIPRSPDGDKNVQKLTGETSGEAEVASVETTLAGPHRPVIGQCCAIQKNSGKGEG